MDSERPQNDTTAEIENLTMADLPEGMLLDVLTNVGLDKLEELCDAIPLIKEVFVKFEGSFDPPSSLEGEYRLELEESVDEVDVLVANIPTTEHSRQKPSYEWIKRHMKKASSVCFTPRSNDVNVWREGTIEYKEFKTFIRNKCALKTAHINVRGFEVEPIVHLFPETTCIELDVQEDLSKFVSDRALSKISNLSVFSPISSLDLEKVMGCRHIEHLAIEFNDRLPLLTVIDEWQQGLRKIGTWFIRCSETDVPIGRTDYTANDEEIQLRCTARRDGTDLMIRLRLREA